MPIILSSQGIFITGVFDKSRSPQYKAIPLIFTVPSAHFVFGGLGLLQVRRRFLTVVAV